VAAGNAVFSHCERHCGGSVALVAYTTWDHGWMMNTSKGGVLSAFVAGGIFSGAEADPFKDADVAADVARDDLQKQLERLLRPAATADVCGRGRRTRDGQVHRGAQGCAGRQQGWR
jgi:hypothetical protein